MSNRGTAALLVAGAALANIAFTGLGSVFGYPDVLQDPAAEVLARFHDNQAAVTGWFLVLAASSALLGVIAVRVGRLSDHRAMRLAVPVGIAASVVQVVGLMRWPLLVPGWAADSVGGDPAAAAAAQDAFTTASHVLGTLVGETLGYLLTATWTLLVVVALGRRYAGTWFTALGGLSAALILTGVLVPLDVPGADQSNFFGYVLWSLWLVAFAVVLLVKGRVTRRDSRQLLDA